MSHVFGTIQNCPAFGDGVDDILQLHTHSLRLYHQLLNFPMQKTFTISRTGLGKLCNYRSDAWMYFEPLLSNKKLNDFVSGVGMDFQFCRQGANRRKHLARLVLTTDKCFLRGKNDLIKYRLTRAKLETK